MPEARIHVGEVPVTVNGRDYVLKPTMRAAMLINRNFNGMAQARANLVAENFDTVVYCLRVGTGLPDKEVRDMDEQVYANGITGDLLVALLRYVAILGNGGKPLPDDVNVKSASSSDDSSLSPND